MRELGVVPLRRVDRGGGEQGVEALDALAGEGVVLGPLGLLVEVLEGVGDHLLHPLGREQGPLGVDRRDLLVSEVPRAA